MAKGLSSTRIPRIPTCYRRIYAVCMPFPYRFFRLCKLAHFMGGMRAHAVGDSISLTERYHVAQTHGMYAQATWKRLLPFFQLPGTIMHDAQMVQVELRPFNDRALNRDPVVLCERVNQASPHLPDGHRLSFTIRSSCCVLVAQRPTSCATRCIFDRGSFIDSSSSLAIFSDEIKNTSRRLLFVR